MGGFRKRKILFFLRLHYVWTAQTQVQVTKRNHKPMGTNLFHFFPAIKIADPDGEQKLAETVRKFPVLCDYKMVSCAKQK